MARIITIPNDNDSVMNAERHRIPRWASSHGWVYTGYNNESDHLAQIRRAAGGRAIEVLDFDCHGNPAVFDHTDYNTALQFGRSLAQIPGFSASTIVYLDACNTGNTSNFRSIPIAQTVADGARCTVCGTKGYMTGTYAESNEQCYRGDDMNPPLYAYPGSQTASGRNVWIAFRPQGIRDTDISELRSMTVGIDLVGRVWTSFDPMSFRSVPMMESNSITVHAQTRVTKELENMLESIMRSKTIEFPQLRMAPDITINYVQDQQVTILDVYANGGLVKDRITGKAWRVPKPDEFATLVRLNLN